MSRNENDEPAFAIPAARRRWLAWAVALGVPLFGCLVLAAMLWNLFFHYVPPGKMLVIVAKDGEALDPGRVLAEPGQKGIQKDVLGEGWHFVPPIIYTTELKDLTVVPPGKVAIVTALGGVAPRDGRVLAEEDDEQGIRKHVLLPGAYRLNPYGYKVELTEVSEIKPGLVGVVRRRLGKDTNRVFADADDEKGYLREVLQPGLYFLNTKEFEVIPSDVGIDQTSYRQDKVKQKSTLIEFPVKDGNVIALECTLEWEILPKDMAQLVARFGDWKAVERNVIDQQARTISRNRGFNYGAQDFLEGSKREKFQADFEHELIEACKEYNVIIRSAFIRNIIIPENFLQPKRDKQLAAETRITNEAKEKTALSNAEVELERSMIQQRVNKVQAETTALVALIDREVENTTIRTDVEIERMRNEYQAKIAEMLAERTRVLGDAETQVTKLKETARNNLYKLKLEVFQNDATAYMKYTLAEKLNPKLGVRLFHSGPGTFWTNMGDKSVNLMVPAGQAPPVAEKK